MLYHLKEPDYEKEAPHDITTRFYGRSPQQILATLNYYAERSKTDGGPKMGDSEAIWWFKREYSAGDIEQVEKGKFIFFTGMIQINEKPLFEELKITDDFLVYVPEENIGNFGLWKLDMSERERGGLYKLRNPIEMCRNMSFVPKDIAMAIMNYDLTPHLDSMRKEMEKRAELSQHPSIKVDGLQRTLEAMNQASKIFASESN